MKTVISYIKITIGCLIVCLGFVFFINPYKFVPGGVFGTSIVLHNLFPSFQVGTFGYMIGIPLLVVSYFLLGKSIGARTLYVTLVTPLMMNGISELVYPTQEALEQLSPADLCGGLFDLSDNLIIPAIIGPVMMGIGTCIMMKYKATSGGSDTIAMMIHKYFRVRFSNALIGVDALVVMAGLFVVGLGFGTDEPHGTVLSFYSLICIFIASRTLAYMASGSKNNKLLFIVTKKHNVELRDFILYKLDRTATALDCEGLYSEENKTTMMMMVRMREVEAVTTAIKGIDPEAFIIVTDAYDAYGRRWKAFPDKHNIEIS